MSPRPERPRLVTELGREQTPPAGADHFERLGAGQSALFLGLGPDPSVARDLAGPGRTVYCMEHPDFKSRMPPSWAGAVPRTWSWLDPGDLPRDLLPLCEIFLYRPGLKFFPSFWGPLFARCRAHALAPAPVARRTALLPGDERGLLVRELATALAAAGFAVSTLPPDQVAAGLPERLHRSAPELFLSVNFAGLDAHGETCHLLRAAGATVAVWCVDNPFHLLSGLRAPFWRDLPLAVTDASFLPSLREHGAGNLLHLPLAAWPGHFGPAAQSRPRSPRAWPTARVRGPLGLPDREKFFAGCAPAPDLEEEPGPCSGPGSGRGSTGGWRGFPSLPCGRATRYGGPGAGRTGPGWPGAPPVSRPPPGSRSRCSGTKAGAGCCPRDRPAGPLDYYGPLAAVYGRSGAVLNMNGLLLPAGLTQRHFDVWAAGGFLLTDAGPGLDIFPRELTREIAFRTPEELPNLARKALAEPAWRQEVAAAWRTLIGREHTYGHRAAALLDWLGLPDPPQAGGLRPGFFPCQTPGQGL